MILSFKGSALTDPYALPHLKPSTSGRLFLTCLSFLRFNQFPAGDAARYARVTHFCRFSFTSSRFCCYFGPAVYVSISEARLKMDD
jgi:hypothetical protein